MDKETWFPNTTIVCWLTKHLSSYNLRIYTQVKHWLVIIHVSHLPVMNLSTLTDCCFPPPLSVLSHYHLISYNLFPAALPRYRCETRFPFSYFGREVEITFCSTLSKYTFIQIVLSKYEERNTKLNSNKRSLLLHPKHQKIPVATLPLPCFPP